MEDIGQGDYFIFIPMIGVLPEHQIKGGAVLEMSFVRMIQQFTASGIFLSGMVACALSIEGLAACERLGFVNLGRHKLASERYDIAQMFGADGKRISEKGILSGIREIKKRYAARFPEHDWLAEFLTAESPSRKG